MEPDSGYDSRGRNPLLSFLTFIAQQEVVHFRSKGAAWRKHAADSTHDMLLLKVQFCAL